LARNPSPHLSGKKEAMTTIVQIEMAEEMAEAAKTAKRGHLRLVIDNEGETPAERETP
jgi:hypothetical protein